SILSIKKDGKGRGKKKTASSQCVNNYKSIIPPLHNSLTKHPNNLAFYNKLTPGYQKNWARYIYSAKKKKTQVARLGKMRKIIRLGYKT
ncbi:YdeI/OmpD-associated family protein, partial [Lysinibacillus agricola]|uniref:YdeI/OmpD-associated family protein n=1 Tax=Lysinibacillus agricola TaxID=2590012 RepID=UPI003C1DA32D